MIGQPIPVKIVVVGDGCVGKTSILLSYTRNQFPKDYVPTVFQTITSTTKVDGNLVNLSLWDTAGQQTYGRLRLLAYSHVDIFLIVFSVVDKNTYQNAKNLWVEEVRKHSKETPIIFVGNKIDLKSEHRTMYKQQDNLFPVEKRNSLKQIEVDLKIKYMECSALTQQNLSQVFEEAIRTVVNVKKPKLSKSKPDVCCSIC